MCSLISYVLLFRSLTYIANYEDIIKRFNSFQRLFNTQCLTINLTNKARFILLLRRQPVAAHS